MNKIDQPFIGVLAIALLRPEAPRHDDDHAVGSHPPPSVEINFGLVSNRLRSKVLRD